ncbi:outer membrane protein assembly factor BamB family protein [Frondihabitans cladoniiphilus]|uniref:Pyrrolo-quinoline quinone repeat domain-containing protein n=1 Tax=Frondihabitans cladoniiphilus TaxID=715785 RepID=A0ABP8VL40_9MICO
MAVSRRRPQGRRPRYRGRVARLWARFSAGTRILVSYLALAAVIALVVGVGVVLQPTYGSLTPYGGTRVDDVRSGPRTSRWAADLAGTLAPGAPAECVRFTAVDLGRDLAVVRADTGYNFAAATDPACTSAPTAFRSRIALFNTAVGVFRWTHDVSGDVPPASGQPRSRSATVDSLSVVDGGTRILVHAVASDRSVAETLSADTGDIVQTTGGLPWNDQDRFEASGKVVAMGHLSTDYLSYEYDLRDVDDLGRVVWSGTGNPSATMIALSDRLLLGDEKTEQVLVSTGAVSAWGPSVDTTLGYAVNDDIVYAAKVTGSGVTTKPGRGFVAVDKTGKELWSSSMTLRGSYSMTRSCLAVTDYSDDHLTCLDYRTGKALWTDQVGAFTSAGSASGQRSDDVYAVSATDSSAVTAIDGRTGAIRFRTPVPAGASVSAAGQTVGYALAYGISGSRSSVIAFDLSSGKRLWTHAAQQQVQVWGGHLIDIGVDGAARRIG